MPEYRPTKEMVERDKLDRCLRKAYEVSENIEEYSRHAKVIEEAFGEEKRLEKDKHHI